MLKKKRHPIAREHFVLDDKKRRRFVDKQEAAARLLNIRVFVQKKTFALTLDTANSGIHGYC